MKNGVFGGVVRRKWFFKRKTKMHEFAPNLTKKTQQKTSGFHGFADVENGRKTGWKTAENVCVQQNTKNTGKPGNAAKGGKSGKLGTKGKNGPGRACRADFAAGKQQKGANKAPIGYMRFLRKKRKKQQNGIKTGGKKEGEKTAEKGGKKGAKTTRKKGGILYRKK